MSERVAASGYAALGLQTSPTAVATPTIFTPYYKQNMTTSLNLIQDKPVYGSKFETFQWLQGTRSHKGGITVMAEPTTAIEWYNMLLTDISDTGSGPYTHTFGLSTTTDPKFYTLDISLVSQVVRFWGVGASKMAWAMQNEEMQFDMSLSALGSFFGREIASITGSGPYTVTFTTTYDPSPTTGLVASDLLYVKSSTGAYTDISSTLTSITNGTTIVLPASPSLSSVQPGDYITLRPQSVSLTGLLTPFTWPNTQYYFAATSSAALSSTTQTRLESGSAMPTIHHNFASDDGSKRSGAFDPASLIRTVGGFDFKTKQYFDTPSQVKQWQAINKQACVVRAYSGTYQMYMVMNNIKQTEEAIQTAFSDVIYQEETYGPQYDLTDGAGMSVVITDNTATP